MNLHKLYLPAIGLLGLGIAYAVYLYIGEHDRAIQASEQQKASAEIIKVKDQAIADRDKLQAQNDARFEALRASIKTGAQASQVLQPIIVPQGGMAPQTVTKAELPPEQAKTLPGAPDAKYTLLSDAQMIDLAKFKVSCDQATTGLSSCQADKGDLQAKFDAQGRDLKKWQQAAQGGTKLTRFLRIALPLGCAGAGAWVGGNRGAKGSAIGALAGGIPCSFIIH